MGKLDGSAGVETIRPQADREKVGITYSSGTNLSALLDDSPDDDSSYVRAAAGLTWPNAWAKFDMVDAPFTLGALGDNQRIYQVRMRARVRMNSSDPGHAAAIDCKLISKSTGKQGCYTRFITSNASTFQAQTGPWYGKNTSGTEWLRPNITNLVGYAVWYHSAGSVQENLRLSEFYVDVDVRNQPVVSGITVTGNDTSTRPTVSWTYTPNVDNDGQFWYRTKIFDSATYGAADFDAETSKAVWDSGEIPGQATSYVIGRDLQIGVTYKAYVKAAQRFHGVPWYSDWAATASSFTLTPKVPPAPTLTVTQDATVPYLRNILTAASNINLLTAQMADLEDGTTTGWEADPGTPGVAIASEGTIVLSGAKSLKITTVAGENRVRTLSGTSGVRIQGGQQVTGMIFVRNGGTARTVNCRLYFWKKDGTAASTATFDGTASSDTGSFLIRTAITTAPADAWYCSVGYRVVSAGASELKYVDQAGLFYGTVSIWTEGGFAGTCSTVVERALATTGFENLAPLQLFTGGDAEQSANGFFATGTFSTVQWDPSEQGSQGTGSILWRVDDASSSIYIGLPSGTFLDFDPDYALAGVPGRAYSFGVSAKASSSTVATLVIEGVDNDGSIISSSSQGITITTGMAEYKVQNYTVPSGACYVRAHIDTSAGTDRRVWVNRVRWYLGATVPTAVDLTTSGQALEWEAVRGANVDDVLPSSLVATTFAEDLEVPPGYTVIYRARNYQPATDDAPIDLSSDPTPYFSTMMDAPGVWVLSVPGDSYLRMQVGVTGDPRSRHEEISTYYPVRPKGKQRPVSLTDFIGGTDGELSFVVKTDDEWAMLDSILSQQKTLWLVHQDHGGRYIRINGDRSWTPQRVRSGNAWLYRATVPYVEADRPAV